MTSTIVGALVALTLIAIVATGQYRAWQRWTRRARRNATIEALLASTTAAGAPLLGERVKGTAAASAAAVPMPTNPVDRLALWLRRRASARRAMSIAVGLLVVAALLIISYPLLTDLYQNKLQKHLRSELGSKSLQQDFRDGAVKVGDALTRIRIPSIGVDVVVVEGTTTSALRAGAGHYVQTPLPCAQIGNVGIAGHRTTYGKPFHDLNKLQPGDQIILDTPVGECTYKVNKAPFSVKPSEVSVLDPDPANPATLTLTTCDPPGSAARRLVVQGSMDPTLTKQTTT